MKVQELIHQLSAEWIDPNAEALVSVSDFVTGQFFATITKVTAVAGRVEIEAGGRWLTEADPEPPPGTTVATEEGQRWERQEGMHPGSWLMADWDGGDPETWTKVAGNYGPVRVVEATWQVQR